jgi:hypothetical protein
LFAGISKLRAKLVCSPFEKLKERCERHLPF